MKMVGGMKAREMRAVAAGQILWRPTACEKIGAALVQGVPVRGLCATNLTWQRWVLRWPFQRKGRLRLRWQRRQHWLRCLFLTLARIVRFFIVHNELSCPEPAPRDTTRGGHSISNLSFPEPSTTMNWGQRSEAAGRDENRETAPPLRYLYTSEVN